MHNKQSSHSHVLKVIILIMIVFLTGCFEVKQDITVNPDGSGKILLEAITDKSPVSLSGSEKSDAESELREMAKKIIQDSTGVDAWKDVRYSQTADGRMSFQGTAYFRDLSKVDIPNFGTGFALTKEKKALIIEMQEKKGKSGLQTARPVEKLTEEEITKKIAETREQWQKMKPLMSVMLASLKKDSTIHLPGKIKEVNNFKKDSENTVSLKLEGSKILAVLDSQMTDESWLRQEAISGGLQQEGGMPSIDESLSEKLFGQKGSVRVKVQVDPKKPLFDYRSEVAAAEMPYQQLLASFGIYQSTTTAPGIGAMRFQMGNLVDDRKTGSSFSRLEVELVMSGEIVDQAQGIRKMTVTRAVDNTGFDLISENTNESEGGMQYRSEQTGEKAKAKEVKKELRLRNPSRAAAAIQELSGVAEMHVPGKDAGAKAQIKNFLQSAGKPVISDALKKAKIEVTVLTKTQYEEKKKAEQEAEEQTGESSSFFGNDTLQENDLLFQIKDPDKKFVALEVLDENGRPLHPSGHSSTTYSEAASHTLSFDQSVPKNAQLAIYIETPASLVRVPFSLNNVSLP